MEEKEKIYAAASVSCRHFFSLLFFCVTKGNRLGIQNYIIGIIRVRRACRRYIHYIFIRLFSSPQRGSGKIFFWKKKKQAGMKGKNYERNNMIQSINSSTKPWCLRYVRWNLRGKKDRNKGSWVKKKALVKTF
jgi:hypothetical protein